MGLRDPRTGETPYAVVQLRKENAEGSAYNLVGFQTRLAWPAQREAFGRLPGLTHAEWLRLGVMHRNTFIDSPRLLDELCGAGEVVWIGAGSLGRDDGKVMLFPIAFGSVSSAADCSIAAVRMRSMPMP